MGMCMGFITISDENIRRVLDDPPLVCQLLAPEDPEWYEQARQTASKRGLLSRLFGWGEEAAVVKDLRLLEGEGQVEDIDKAWQGLHYLLTGSDWKGEPPLNFLLAWGEDVGKGEEEYLAARVLTAEQTAAAQKALRGVSREELSARYDPMAMRDLEIYPDIWDPDSDTDDACEYVLDYAETLRDFLDRTVKGGLGIVITLS